MLFILDSPDQHKNLWVCKTMLSEQALTFEQNPVTMILFREEPYFRATDVTKALGYVNGSQAIRAQVEPDDIKTLAELSGDVSAVLCPTENERNASTDCHGFKQRVWRLCPHLEK